MKHLDVALPVRHPVPQVALQTGECPCRPVASSELVDSVHLRTTDLSGRVSLLSVDLDKPKCECPEP